MTCEKREPTATAVSDLLARHQFRFKSEVELHTAIAVVFYVAQVEFVREYRLSDRDRVDFYFPNSKLALEVKVAGSVGPAMRQVDRYMSDERVSGVVLAASRAWARNRLPSRWPGKEFSNVYLRRPI